ncbi:hypothetical protein KBD81_02855 [Candidatus Woesebacteria bacterium]|nr:hypothetical protein [Candidatus Woesebacteria bacterium]
MKTRTFFLYAAFAGLIGVVILLFFPYPGQQELMNEKTLTPAPQAQDAQNMSPQYGDLPEEQIAVADRAIMDLLNTGEGLNPSMVSVVSVEAQEFGDSSLGCPVAGTNYSQVITPGYKVMLTAQGEMYDYRLDMGESTILCEQ